MPLGQSMRIERDASWQDDVLPSWKRSSPGNPNPNTDVWHPLPLGTAWSRAVIEPNDIPFLYLIGSGDIKKTYGSYHLPAVAEAVATAENDKHNHTVRIQSIEKACSEGKIFEPTILVAGSSGGPFVAIDGNHRMTGFMRCGELVGREVFLGIHDLIPKSFNWYRWAIA